MHASNWPLAKKPTTNLIIQLLLMAMFGGVFVLFPLTVIGVCIALALFFGIRSTYRALRSEWLPLKPDWVVISDKGAQPLKETDEGKLFAIVGLKNKCADCGGEGFFEGPSGGMSTNIICRNAACRSKFNITSFGNNHGTVDRIGRDPLSALNTYPPESFGHNLTPDQLAAAKAKIIADETPKNCNDCTAQKVGPEATCCGGSAPKNDCGTCHAPLDATGQCPND